MMIHDGFGMGIGNAKDLRELADLLDKTSDNIASIYADRTGQPAAQWRDSDAGRDLVRRPGGRRRGPGRLCAGRRARRARRDHARGDAGTCPSSPSAPASRSTRPRRPMTTGSRPTSRARTVTSRGTRTATATTTQRPEGDTDHSHWAPDGTQTEAGPRQADDGRDGHVPTPDRCGHRAGPDIMRRRRRSTALGRPGGMSAAARPTDPAAALNPIARARGPATR